MKKGYVSIIIINYNTKQLLSRCMDHIREQTWDKVEVIFIDNDSKDGSCEFFQKTFPTEICVGNRDNLGYAKAANQGIKMAKGEYVMILNPDVLLGPKYLENCIKKLEENDKAAATSGKVYKYDFANDQATKFIDTVGLFSYPNRRFIDDGQGLEDNGQFQTEKEVFGVSGACPVYRRTALEDIKLPFNGDPIHPSEYLDEDFFMYKEDVDISWRFQLAGWSCWYVPSAIAYHGRGTGVLKRFSNWEVYKNRSKLNAFQKSYSYTNQRLMQIKNELVLSFLKHFFAILWKEILITGYIIFREPFLLKAWWNLIKLTPKALKKRRFIMKHKRASFGKIEQWFNKKQTPYAQKNTNTEHH